MKIVYPIRYLNTRKEDNSMNSQEKKGVGVILLIIAIIALCYSVSLHSKGTDIYFNEDMSRGTRITNNAEMLKYGAFGIGAIGVVLMLAGFLQNDQPQKNNTKREKIEV